MDQNFKLRVDTTVVETFQRTREKELSLT